MRGSPIHGTVEHCRRQLLTQDVLGLGFKVVAVDHTKKNKLHGIIYHCITSSGLSCWGWGPVVGCHKCVPSLCLQYDTAPNM